MAGKGNYHIDWDDFTTTSSERFQSLVGKKEFSDVTLVSDDGTRIPSHQVILASGCAFFEKLLVEETSKNPLIFMRGVDASLLDPLLNFLYTGRAEVSEDLITKFVALAEDLGVEGLAKTSPDQDKDPIDTTIEEGAEDDKADVANIIARSLEDPIKEEPKTTNFPKKCQKCQAVFNDRDNWTKHVRIHPNPKNASMIKLPERDSEGLLHCFDCNKKVKCHSNFRRHVQKNHLKIDYKCYQFDFQHRDAHVMSRHRKKHKADVTI